MDEEEKEEYLEEQLGYLRAVLQERMRENPKAMSNAIAVVILNSAIERYDDFIVGLENEFDRQDKLNLFNSYVKYASCFWYNAEVEKACEMACKILEEFEIQKKNKRRVKRGLAKSTRRLQRSRIL